MAVEKNFAQTLSDSILERSDQASRLFRASRATVMQAFAGPMHTIGQLGVNPELYPLNLIYQLVNILTPALAMDVDVDIQAKLPGGRPFSREFEAAMQFFVDDTDLHETGRLAMVDAFFGRGIIATGLGQEANGKFADPGRYLMDPGQVGCRRVSENDFIVDMRARHRDEVQFIGERMVVPYEWAMDSGLYDKKKVEKLKGKQIEREDALRADNRMVPTTLVDQIEIAEVFLPQYNSIVTLPGDMTSGVGFLREDDYEGPEHGPWRILTYCDVPDSMEPIAPVQAIYSLYQMVNKLAYAVKQRALAARGFVLVDPGDESTAKMVREVKDGGVAYGKPESAKAVKLGGVDQEAYTGVAFWQDQYNRIAQNPELAGGIQAQSGTLGQDQMLMSGVSAGLSDKQARVRRFLSGVLQDMSWYVFDDDSVNGFKKELEFNIEGVTVPFTWEPGNREGALRDYALNVKAYPAGGNSPQERYEALRRWSLEMMPNLLQAGAQQGLTLDIEKLTKMTLEPLGYALADELVIPATEEAGAIETGGVTVEEGNTNISSPTQTTAVEPEGTPDAEA